MVFVPIRYSVNKALVFFLKKENIAIALKRNVNCY